VAARYHITPARLAQEWRRADAVLLVLVVIGSLAFHVLAGADKLWRVMRAMGVALSYGEALCLRLGSGPLRFLIPFKVGELVTVVFFWRHKDVPLERAAGAVAFDRGLNVAGATFWLLAGLLLWWENSPHGSILLAAGLGLAFIVFTFLSPLHAALIRVAGALHAKLGSAVAGLLAPFCELRAPRKVFFLLYGVVFAFRPIVVCYFLFRAFGVHPDPRSFTALTSVAMFAGHIPTPLGMGPREAALVLLFKEQAPEALVLNVGLFLTITVHVIPLIAGLPWVPWFTRRMAERPLPPGEDGRCTDTRHPTLDT
jgi:hypothetical protein